MEHHAVKSAEIQSVIMKLLSDDRRHSVKEIKQYLAENNISGYSEGKFAGCINTLLRNGSIQKIDRGTYASPEAEIHLCHNKPDCIGNEVYMNFFEQELRKLFENSDSISNPRFTGRVCLARLTDATNVKLEFITLGTHEHYEAIKATIINRSEGPVDSTTFRFSDILGKKVIPGNPNFSDGLYPHIWKSGDKYEWYAYKPTPRDMEILSDTVDNYLEVFHDLSHEQDMGQQMY